MNRTIAENIVDRLVDAGARLSGTRKQAVEEVHRMVKDDYIPGGKIASKVTHLRAAPPGYRCGIQVGADIQSGPFYCGKPASLVGNSDEGTDYDVFACEAHEGDIRKLQGNQVGGLRKKRTNSCRNA